MLKNCQQACELAEAILVDQPSLETKIRKALLCNARDARRALVEVLKFMSLASSNGEGPLTPSHRVDLAWHELILFTRTYHPLCMAHFGMFVHHQPGGTQQENRMQFAKTLQRYTDIYGTPPVDLWGTHDQRLATCGNCESEGE